MSENIRFRVHTSQTTNINSDFDDIRDISDISVYEEIIYTQNYNNDRVNNLLRLLNMTSVLGPLFTYTDPFEIAIQNSNEEQELHRQENISVIINCQNYNTTEKKYEECSICTEKYEDDETVSVLDCGHVYHPNCIKEWGHYNPSCPVCKTGIPTYTKYLAR